MDGCVSSHAGVRVLNYAGDADYICNWYGNKAWTLALSWPGSEAFNAAEDTEWAVDGAAAGQIRSAGGFSFARVYGAGHMVPMNQPKNALALLNLLINDEL